MYTLYLNTVLRRNQLITSSATEFTRNNHCKLVLVFIILHSYSIWWGRVKRGFALANRCKVCGPVFVVSSPCIHSSSGNGCVPPNVRGEVSIWVFGGRFFKRVTCLRVTCPGTLCSCSVHESPFYWCCHPSETLKVWSLQPRRPPLGPEGERRKCRREKKFYEDSFSLPSQGRYF